MDAAKGVFFSVLCLSLGWGCSSGPFDNFWPGPKERVNPTDVTAPTTIQPGTTWTGRNLPNNAFWSALAFGNYNGGVFVAMDGGNSLSSSAAYSTDNGATWHSATTRPTPDHWASITYGNGMFVTVSNSSEDVAVSADGGVNWTTYPSVLPVGVNWNSVAYGVVGGTAYFVAVGTNPSNTNNIAAYTTNPSTVWTTTTMPDGDIWVNITYGNGMMVAIPQACATAHVDIFNGPSSWTWGALTPVFSWSNLAFGNNAWVTLTQNAGFAEYSTNNANNFARTPASVISLAPFALAFGSGVFVGVGNLTADAYTSPDGITWTHRNLPFNVDWKKVAYGNNTFVAIAGFNNYNQYAATSP